MRDLEDVLRAWAQESPTDWVVRMQAERDAQDAIRFYRRERNGMSIWRAYLALRRAGLPVWDSVLVKFDQWAVGLEGAERPEEIARVMELAGSGKAPKGLARLATRERDWRIASAVKHVQREEGLGVYAAFSWVAQHGYGEVDQGLDVKAIKAAYYATFPSRPRPKRKPW